MFGARNTAGLSNGEFLKVQSGGWKCEAIIYVVRAARIPIIRALSSRSYRLEA